MQGVPVLGGLDEIDRVLSEAHADVVLVTIPHARARAARRGRRTAATAADVSCRFVRREIDLDPVVVMGAGVE